MAGEIWVKVRPRRIPPTVFGRGERPGRVFFFFTGGSLPKGSCRRADPCSDRVGLRVSGEIQQTDRKSMKPLTFKQ